VRSGSAPDSETLSSSIDSTPTAIVVAGDEEARVLLRGLLRLHQFRVDGEAVGSTQAIELIRVHRPSLLVVDAHLAEGSVNLLIGHARGLAPGLRVILIASVSHPPTPPSDPNQRPDAVLLRPFRMHQFVEVLVPPGAGRPLSPP
jgi:DNA-binding NtrC family response regulator